MSVECWSAGGEYRCEYGTISSPGILEHRGPGVTVAPREVPAIAFFDVRSIDVDRCPCTRGRGECPYPGYMFYTDIEHEHVRVDLIEGSWTYRLHDFHWRDGHPTPKSLRLGVWPD